MLRRVRRPVLLAAVALVWIASCGGPGSGELDPTGGEICLPNRKVCANVPPAALDRTIVLHITKGTDGPPAKIGDAYDITVDGHTTVALLKPARVTFALEGLPRDGVDNDNILRVYTKDENGDWAALASPRLDRVRGEVGGDVIHFSPFAVLRADRLPDGGLP